MWALQMASLLVWPCCALEVLVENVACAQMHTIRAAFVPLSKGEFVIRVREYTSVKGLTDGISIRVC